MNDMSKSYKINRWEFQFGKANKKTTNFNSISAEHKSVVDFDPTNSLKRCNSTPIINHILPPTNKATVSSGPTNTMNLTTNNATITSTTSRSRYFSTKIIIKFI